MSEADVIERVDNPVILSSRVIGTPVFNREQERIGHVDDLSIEKLSGRAVYAILSFGGFLGIGEKFHPVPWSVLGYDSALGGFIVPLDKSVLASAPNYDREELRELGGADYRRYSETIYQYYAPPYI